MVASCPLEEKENYRDEIFKLIPTLQWVDGKDKDGNIKEENEDEDDSEDIVIGEDELEGLDEVGDSEGAEDALGEIRVNIGKRGGPEVNEESEDEDSVVEEEGTLMSNNNVISK
jgi:acidic leucine-rich nuclear phosphoprotein 32 family member A/C/D